MKPLTIVLLVFAHLTAVFAQDGGGGHSFKDCPGCLSASQNTSLRALIQQHRSLTPQDASTASKYTFYPHAGILSAGDAFVTNYTDTNSAAGQILDPLCTNITYDGHRGIDSDILSWDHQDVGVPVFAALAGTVIAAHDGEPDRNTVWNNQPANYVVLNHGGGHTTQYYHFKTNSVLVSVGQTVAAGQQIGSVGSSGISTGPHLHFQTEFNGVAADPFQGPCGPAIGMFQRQPTAHPAMYLRDLGITAQNLDSWTGPREGVTRIGTFVTGLTDVSLWISLMKMSAGSTWRVRILRPNGTVAVTGNETPFSNIYFSAWSWWRRSVNLDTIGTWNYELTINGQVTLVPFTVVSSAGQIVNRAPVAAPVIFENPPQVDEVPVCRVATYNVFDDPDYDLVRYRYVWRINGAVQRDVTTAATADALRQGLASTGDTIVCEVTPSDGSLNGPMSSVSAIVGQGSGPNPEIAVEQPAGTGLTDNASTVAFGVTPVGTPVQRVFTIRNPGLMPLTNLAASFTGTNAGMFSAGAFGLTTVPAGSFTTVTVTFNPTSMGDKTATLRIASNDFDENPFDVALTGNGAGPEIAVEQPAGTNLNTGATVNFGSPAIGSPSQRVFTIRNTGTLDLNLSGAIQGTHAAMFSPSAFNPAVIAAGGSTTWTVTYTPTSAGAKTATLRITSDDADEGIIDITLSGNSADAEIAVEQPAGTNLVDGTAVVSFGDSLVGVGVPRVFTIRNSGVADLTGLTAGVVGTHASMFVPGAFGSTTLAPGAFTTLTVTFTPSSGGAKSATLQIGSNDGDENPFDIGLSGNGLAPEIGVEQPAGTNLVDGAATVTFGDASLIVGVPRVFTIRNTGTASLTGLAASFVGTDSGMFSAGAFGSTSVLPGASTTVTVTFSPSSLGAKTATFRIASNDADENPFDITVTGNGAAPEIVVEQPAGTNLVDGVSTAAFGSVPAGSSAPLIFTVRNTGGVNLTGLAASFVGTDAGLFSAGTFGSTTLVPGGFTTVTVTFAPTNTGAKSATFRIASNDSDENPFDIALTGTGAGPEIAVEQPAGTNLADGTANVSFGTPAIGTSSQQVFTIRNLGNSDLTGLAASFAGTDAALFSAGAFGTTTVGAGTFTTVTVTFAPTAAGVKSAILRIASNDLDENPFDINLVGIATNPEIELEQPAGTALADGNSTVDFGPVALNGSGQRVFTIRNSGTGALTNFAASFTGDHAADFSAGAVGNPSLAGGQSTTFTVTFSPSAPGPRQAVLRLANSDADENPFEVNLTGRTGTPEIVVEYPAGTGLVDGAAVEIDSLLGPATSKSITLVLRNTGDAALSGLAASFQGAPEFSAGAITPTSLDPGGALNLVVTFTASSNGTRAATLRIASNDADENPFDLALSATRLDGTTLNGWGASYGLTGSALFPAADTDGDSVTLLEEYAYGLNPTIADAFILTPGSGVVGLPGVSLAPAGFLRVEYLRRRSDPALRYEVEFGDGLSAFLPASGSENAQALSLDWQRVVVEDTVTSATHPRRFGRVKVSYGP